MKAEKFTQKNIEEKVLAYCRRHAMFCQGEKVVLGVSGGADSVCLLFVLLQLKEQLGIGLHVVHVNHGVREDASRDAMYVESLCREYGIGFSLKEISMNRLAAQLGVGSEEAGRIARYEAFEKACEDYGCTKIAVAHNRNDRAETMLFHLFRGTGLKGLAGISPVRDKVVRPLLCLEREEIEWYLENRGIHYKQDSTNATDDYTRNRIRHHVLSYAKEYISAGAVANMNRAADIFAEEEEYLEGQTEESMKACAKKRQLHEADLRYEICVESFCGYHPVIQKRILMKLLKQLSPGQQDITAVHIEDIRTLFLRDGNRMICLPYGIRGERSYGTVWLTRNETDRPQALEEASGFGFLADKEQIEDTVFKQEGYGILLPDGSEMIFRLLEIGENPADFQGFSENRYTKRLDYDKINGSLWVRTRKTGDYLTIRKEAFGDKDGWAVKAELPEEFLRHKKLKDYMIHEKIPKGERNEIPLLADGDHILWVVGYRISEAYKITKNTKRILQVQFKK